MENENGGRTFRAGSLAAEMGGRATCWVYSGLLFVPQLHVLFEFDCWEALECSELACPCSRTLAGVGKEPSPKPAETGTDGRNTGDAVAPVTTALRFSADAGNATQSPKLSKSSLTNLRRPLPLVGEPLNFLRFCESCCRDFRQLVSDVCCCSVKSRATEIIRLIKSGGKPPREPW